MSSSRRQNGVMLPLTELTVKQLEDTAINTDVDRLVAVSAAHEQVARSTVAARTGIVTGVGPSAAKLPRKHPIGRKPLPRPQEVGAGWGDLLKEISASARRVRVAKGGRIGANGQVGAVAGSSRPGSPSAPRSPHAPCVQESAGPAVAAGSQEQQQPQDEVHRMHGNVDGEVHSDDDAQVWPSYRVDDNKVPDSILATIWRRAVDSKHCTEEVPPLLKVPRLSIAKREVEQLPPVYDIQHWRQVNKRKKDQRQAKEDAEHFPSLDDMLTKIFGSHVPPELRMQERIGSVGDDGKRSSILAGRLAQKSPDLHSSLGLPELDNDEVRKDVMHEMLRDAFPVEEGCQASKFVSGVIKKGRRNAFDEGQPWMRNGAPLAELKERRAESEHRRSKLLGVLQEAQDSEDAERAQQLNHLADASKRVHEKCARKVQRMHAQFVRKQGQLSGRLKRRVKRLQMDFEEIHDMKTSTILPSVVHQPETTPATRKSRGEDVLHFLKRHRYKAERERRSMHDIYMQQVDKFQGFLKLLADPNRVPDKAEIYLSECFRYVLAAGLIVDNTFFFRVLEQLDLEDFQKVGTVNLLAACVQSFDVGIRSYVLFLQDRGIPIHRPNPRPDLVRGWEDWAPWNGVDLRSAEGDDCAAENGDGLEFSEDPFPFAPILPDAPADSSELVSRDDPVAKVLQTASLDMVLQRYGLTRESRREKTQRLMLVEKLEVEQAKESGGFSVQFTEASCTEVHLCVDGHGGSQSNQDRCEINPSKQNLTRIRTGARRPQNTLSKMRSVAEQLGDMHGAPDKDRPRAATQAPTMAPIVERAFEVLE